MPWRLPALLLAALLLPAEPARAQDRPLRLVLNQELTLLDPVLSTNTATRAFGYMVWDTLVAVDSTGAYRPQMLEAWEASEDRLRYTFTLRPGLVWSDGTPVTPEDCIASLRRWGARDGLGQQLMAATASMQPLDERRFVLALSRPFGFVVEALGKPGNNVPFMMPARVAATDPNRAITEFTGSGPFTFRREEWRQGERVVFRRNPRYLPRAEPADGLAGGKVAHFEVVEFVSITDAATRVAALQGNEVDMLEFVPPDFLERLRRDRNVVIGRPPGILGNFVPYVNLNHAQPPFDDPRVRQAVQQAVDQTEIMQAMGLPPGLYEAACPSIYPCEGAGAITADALRGRSPERARALLREAGYAGQRVVLLHPTDSVTLSPVAAVLAEQLRRVGFNLEVWTSDWASVAQRRTNREAPERGGWNLVTVGWSSIDVTNPLLNAGTAYNCRPYPGWFCDEAMRPLLERYAASADPAERRALAAAIQDRAVANVNLVMAGQFTLPQARRANLAGAIDFAYPVLWNLRRQGR